MKVFGSPNSKVVIVVLVMAALITMGRLALPPRLGYDQSIQTEAAYRLLMGLGLTSTFYAVTFPDLNQKPEPRYLTAFPPGHSLIIAGLLSLHLPLAVALKIIFGIITLLGWLGWAVLAGHCLERPICLGKRTIPVHYALAAVLPIWYTPPWHGTDIYLWAGLPFIVLGLSRSAANSGPRFRRAAVVGLLFGFLFAVRYASLFIAVAALPILIRAHYPRFRDSLKAYGVFLASAAVFILPVLIYTRVVTNAGIGLPPNISLYGFDHLFHTGGRILTHWSMIATMSGIEPVERLIEHLRAYPVLNAVFGMACFAVLLTLPWAMVRLKKGATPSVRQDLSLPLAWVPISLVAFLMVCMLTNPGDFQSVARYYLPASLPVILLGYKLLSRWPVPDWIKVPCVSAVLIFLGYQAALAAESLPRAIQETVLKNLRGPYNAESFLLARVTTSVEVKALQKRFPEAIFYYQHLPDFIHDASSGCRPIPGSQKPKWLAGKEFWERAYVDKPTRIFWILEKTCPGICGTEEEPLTIDALANLPRRVVYSNDKDNYHILVTDLPAGFRFADLPRDR